MESSDHVRGRYTASRGRVAMLVTNPCVNDSRVIRAAETVAAEGFEVIVLATMASELPETEERNGVVYRRLAPPLPEAKSPPREQTASVHTGPSIQTTKRTSQRPLRNQSWFQFGAAVWRQTWRLSKRAKSTAWPPLRRTVRRAASPPARKLYRAGRRQSLRTVRQLYRTGKRQGIRTVRQLYSAGRRQGALFFHKGWRGAGKHLRYSNTHEKLKSVAGTRRAEALFEKTLDSLQPDVIHAHDFVTLPVAFKAASRCGAICIYDSHELEAHRNISRSALDRWLCEQLERRYIRRADAVITVCDSIADHLARSYRIRRPEVIMNAPDSENLTSLGRDVRSDLGLPRETPLAIYVGRITIGRGIENLARALKHMPDFHLALVGAVNTPTVEAATRISLENGTAARFHILPPVPPSAVLPYIASADVSVVPIQNVCLSYFYCLPNKLIESSIAGLPVAASDFPEIRRYVELGRCGVTMDVEDPEDIARAVGEAYRRRSELRLDPARRALIEAEYGWETQRLKLARLYDRLWDGRAERATAAE